MDPAFIVVTHLPLAALWRGDGAGPGLRKRALDAEQLADLLRTGLIHFVVANVGEKLNWIDPAERYSFWRSDVKPHLADASRIRPDDYSGAYCYVASEWEVSPTEPAIVVLECYH